MLDVEIWDSLLHQYVNDRGQVNYAAWKTESAQLLKDWLQQISQVDLQSLDRHEQLALWLNLYNALVIDQVLTVYPIDSIRPTVLGIPNWLAFLQFFQRKIYRLGQQEYSLNGIEHGIIRPQFGDPRIHFALVCAAIGCPLLRNQAYQPHLLQAQLEEDAERFINNPEKVRYESPVLYCSKIFQWYQQDFIRVATGIPRFIQPYLSGSLSLTNTTPIRYLPYDWQLNHSSTCSGL